MRATASSLMHRSLSADLLKVTSRSPYQVISAAEDRVSALVPQPNSALEWCSVLSHPRSGIPRAYDMPCCRKRLRRSRSPARSARIFSICDTISFSFVRGYFVPHLRIDGIPGSAEVHDYRYCADRERLKDHTSAEVPNRWKYEHIGRSQTAEDFGMAQPAAESNSLFDSKGFRELFKRLSFRPVADHGKAGSIAPQKRSSRAQSKITSLSGNQAANKDQLKLSAGLRTARVTGTD